MHSTILEISLHELTATLKEMYDQPQISEDRAAMLGSRIRVWYQPQHSDIDFTLTILVIMDKQLAHV